MIIACIEGIRYVGDPDLRSVTYDTIARRLCFGDGRNRLSDYMGVVAQGIDDAVDKLRRQVQQRLDACHVRGGSFLHVDFDFEIYVTPVNADGLVWLIPGTSGGRFTAEGATH